MPRVARIYTEEGIFHILTRGNNKQRKKGDEEKKGTKKRGRFYFSKAVIAGTRYLCLG